MQYAEPSPTTRLAAHQRTLRLAWVTLTVFSLLFLGLVAWVGFTLHTVYQTATKAEGGTLIVRGPTEWVAWRPADRTLYQAAVNDQILSEGDAVRAASSAGYGQVATVRLFEQSQFDLWAGAEVALETLQTSRWHSATLVIAIRQSAGYVRYDLKADQPYAHVNVAVRVGDAVVQLTPGGSYSLDLRRSKRVIARADGGNALEADVAVRTGSAMITGANGLTRELRAREHALIDAAGLPGLAVPARWDLIRDGGFSQYSDLEYNNTTLNDPTIPQSAYWKVYSGPDLPLKNRGFFGVTAICRPPNIMPTCDLADRRTAAWFYRAGGQTNSFIVGLKQELGVDGAGLDVSEYRALQITLWVRVLHQSLKDAGERGSECPVTIRLVAKRNGPADPEEQRDVCVFIDADQTPPTVTEAGMVYYHVQEAEWAQISFNLREAQWLPDYRYLRRIQIFAQGHDYDSRVADVALVGEQ